MTNVEARQERGITNICGIITQLPIPGTRSGRGFIEIGVCLNVGISWIPLPVG